MLNTNPQCTAQDEILASGGDEAGGVTPSPSAGQTPVATPPAAAGHLSPEDELGPGGVPHRLLDGQLGGEVVLLLGWS